MAKFLKSRLLVFGLVLLAVAYGIKDFQPATFLANPLEYILLSFGKIALYLWLINCYIPFFILITPKKWSLANLKAIRRPLGVMAYFFALLHVSTYLTDQPADVWWDDLQRIFIINGLIGFFIFSLLAFTSNNLALKKLGKTIWKRLHRLVYLLVLVLFFHIAAKDKGNYLAAFIIMAPLVITYIIRLIYYYSFKPR